jgi:hypothetical protein
MLINIFFDNIFYYLHLIHKPIYLSRSLHFLLHFILLFLTFSVVHIYYWWFFYSSHFYIFFLTSPLTLLVSLSCVKFCWRHLLFQIDAPSFSPFDFIAYNWIKDRFGLICRVLSDFFSPLIVSTEAKLCFYDIQAKIVM